MAISLGSSKISKVFLGDLPVSAVYLGLESIYKSFTSAGVDKVGNQTAPMSTWTTIIGRAVRSGFPETVIEQNAGFVVPGGMKVNLNAQNTHAYTNPTVPGRIFNLTTGQVIAEATGSYSTTVVMSASGYTPTVDSLIVVQTSPTSNAFGRDQIVAGNGTYLTAVAV